MFIDVYRMGRRRKYIGISRKAEGHNPLGKPRRRWVDNIKMDVVEMGMVEEWRPLGC
jgi:hypothetical protein